MDWQVGEIAICITPGSPMEGMEVVILSPAYPVPYKPDLIHQVDPGMDHGPFAMGWGAERRHLAPLPDPNTPSTWDECVFKPQELVRVED